MTTSRSIGFLVLGLGFAVIACAQEKPLNLLLKDLKHSGREGVHFLSPSALTFHESLADTWCTSVNYTFYSNSKHPGPNADVKYQQANYGYGGKCRIGTTDPLYFSIGGLLNSQDGAAGIMAFGKQVDLLEFWRIKVYVGGALTAISYEMPAKRRTAYGIVPLAHRGISFELPYAWGSIGWEEHYLPQKIRLRSFEFKINKKINIF